VLPIPDSAAAGPGRVAAAAPPPRLIGAGLGLAASMLVPAAGLFIFMAPT
jgi:hypothetical protein